MSYHTFAQPDGFPKAVAPIAEGLPNVVPPDGFPNPDAPNGDGLPNDDWPKAGTCCVGGAAAGSEGATAGCDGVWEAWLA